MEPEKQPEPITTKPKSNKLPLIILTLLVLVALGATGYVYKLLKTEKANHAQTADKLTAQTKVVDDNAQVIRDSRLEPSFRTVMQDNANRTCTSGSGVVFNTTTSEEKNSDKTVKKYFAVGQFVCNNGNTAIAGPIRFVGVESYDGSKWDFTYGSSSSTPTSLPDYIFKTDPALYNRKFNNPSKL